MANILWAISPNFSLLSAVVGCGVWPCAPEAHSPMVAAAAARRHTLAQLKLYQYLRHEAGALLAVFAVGIALLAVFLVDMDELHTVGLASRRGAAIQVGARVGQATRHLGDLLARLALEAEHGAHGLPAWVRLAVDNYLYIFHYTLVLVY